MRAPMPTAPAKKATFINHPNSPSGVLACRVARVELRLEQVEERYQS